MLDTSSISEQGQQLEQRWFVFRLLAALWIVVELATMAFQWHIQHALVDEGGPGSMMFVYLINRIWMPSALVCVLFCFYGIGWMACAYRSLGKSDSVGERGDVLVLLPDFLFPLWNIFRPPFLFLNLHRESLHRAGRPQDVSPLYPIFGTCFFWIGRLFDILRMLAKNDMVQYADYAKVARYAVLASTCNLAFMGITFWLVYRVMIVQRSFLADGEGWERQERDRFLAEVETQPELREAAIRLTYGDIYFQLEGRLSRNTFLKYWFIDAVTGLGVFGLLYFMLESFSSTLPGVFLLVLTAVTLLAMVPFSWTLFCLEVKRWHDLGLSGWMVFFRLIPVLGVLYSIWMLFFKQGQQQRNDYGEREEFGFLVPEDALDQSSDFFKSL